MSPKPIVLVGGYGVTGQRVSRLLRRRNPNLPLVIAGRSLDKARALADELGGARGAQLDVSDPGFTLEESQFGAVGLIAYDQTQNTVAFAARHGAPYLAVSGGAFEFCVDAIPGFQAATKIPVVLATYWFSGAVTLPTLALAQRFAAVDSVEVGVVIDRGDAGSGAGPATIADFQRISGACPSTLSRIDGRYTWRPPEASKGVFQRGDGADIDGVGSVSTDVLSIGAATGAPNVSVLEGWAVSSSRAAGGPACDEVVISMRGTAKDGRALAVRQTVACPRDPSSFTAISVAVLLERLAGVSGGASTPAGVYLPEHIISPTTFVEELKAEGVTISET